MPWVLGVLGVVLVRGVLLVSDTVSDGAYMKYAVGVRKGNVINSSIISPSVGDVAFGREVNIGISIVGMFVRLGCMGSYSLIGCGLLR